MSGRLAVVGLGPGDPRYLTPEAADALAAARRRFTATGLISTACRRAAGQSRHAVRQPRGRCARRRRAPPCRAGRECRRRVRRRSRRVRHGGGDLRGNRSRPGQLGARSTCVFVPGITAMLAVAAKIGAPLGHDFCALSLSDNLKPWDLIERRLDAAAGAGFVIALYNPVSRARPWQFGNAIERLRRHLPPPRRRSCSAAPSAGRMSASASRRSRRPMRRPPIWRRWSSSARARRA